MGGSGFYNLGAAPQCVKCGSRELTDLSSPKPSLEEPKYITDAAEKIVKIMEPYFKKGTDLGSNADKSLKTIGKKLDEKGGITAMRQAFMLSLSIAHRRFGYTGGNRYLEIVWNRIGDWQG